MNNKAQNIGLDLRMLGPDFGIGRYTLEIAKRILEAGTEHHFTLFVRDPKTLIDLGIRARNNTTVVIADYRHYSWQEQILFARLLNKYNLDLVHFFNFNVPYFYNKPYIVTVHDLVHHKLPGNKKSRFLHRLAYKAVINHAILNAKNIITVSNFSKREILSVYNIPSDKIKVIYEAAQPVSVTDSDINEVKQKYGLNKPYIIFIGVMERKKNILTLVKAFDLLKDQFKLNIQLVLVGKPDPHYPEILQQAQTIKYRRDLVITGAVSDKAKYALLKGSEAFISASKFEGFGLPGLEAMSMGVPLVVSNIETFNEVYDNGAIFFEADDIADIAQKISFMLNDEKYKQLISNNAYLRAQFFSWDKAAKETLAVYEQ